MEIYLQIIVVIILIACLILILYTWRKMGAYTLRNLIEENNFIWSIILTVFSVTLYYSLYNASIVNIVSYGDFIYWFILRSIPIEWYELFSTMLYTFLIFGDILIVGYIKLFHENFLNKIKFNNKIILSMIIGSSPMIVYYIVYITAETFYPHILTNPQAELLKALDNLLKIIP